MVVLVAAILLWMADLQLFGRAPMAAFSGDAAQNRENERGLGRRDSPLSSLLDSDFQSVSLGFSVGLGIHCYKYLVTVGDGHIGWLVVRIDCSWQWIGRHLAPNIFYKL